MVKSVSQHQRGFTLIEMSIVLVIIGLIIGGILKGQELIESSRQKNVISQIDRLKAGTTSFVDRFRGLPGDFSRRELLPNSGMLAGGNDDGIIGVPQASADGLATTADSVLGTENAQYFNMLLATGMGVNGQVTSGVTIACFSGLCPTASPLPSSAFPATGLTMHYGTHEGGATTGTAQSKRSHWLLLSRIGAMGALAGGTADGAVSPERGFQIDNKYDDGSAGGGNIRTTFANGTGCGGATTEYVATTSSIECHLLFAVE